MSASTLLEKGTELAKQATEADNAGRYEEAFDLYQATLDHLCPALRFERNEKTKEILRKKIIEYTDRGEKLKQSLEKEKPSGVACGDTEERGRLRRALEEAIVREKPNVRWDDVAGLYAAKDLLKEAVIFPRQFPALFTGKRKPWKGILLYGPPGTGKTHLSRAVATEAEATFFSISCSDLLSKWQGESERLVKQLFAMARESVPAVIFIDEVDSMCSARNDTESESSKRIKTEFLVQMNATDGVLVLGATNTPWALDVGIRRRFEKRVYIPLPDAHSRAQMFALNLGDTPHNVSAEQFRTLGQRTEGYSGADINIVVRDALMWPIRLVQYATHYLRSTATDGEPEYEPCSPGHADAIEMSWTQIPQGRLREPKVSYADLERSILTTRPSVAPAELARHDAFTRDFGIDG